MATVKIKNCKIGEGNVKICVPIIKQAVDEIKKEVAYLQEDIIDIVEWRIDFMEDIEQEEVFLSTLSYLRKSLTRQLLLLSFRTKGEGGNKEISLNSYKELLHMAIDSGNIDVLDVELFSGDDVVKDIVKYAHQKNVKVIGSSHDFYGTPSYEDMKSRLIHMKELGCDIAKLAVMPKNNEDVMSLLRVTTDVHKLTNMCPVVSMAMGDLGKITRICGELYGSCISFGSRMQASAPGQIEFHELHAVLSSIHNALQETHS